MSALAHEKDPGASWLKDARPEAPSLPIEKMPQLNASLERFCEGAGELLADICGSGIAGATDRISTTTTFELLGAYHAYPAAVLRSQALDARGLMIFDAKIAEVLLAAIFGVDPGANSGFSGEGAPPRLRTELENQLVAGLARIFATSLQDAFSPVASFDLVFESFAEIVDLTLLGPREMPAIMAQYTIKTRGGQFRLIVVLPQTLTTPLGDMFARGPDPNAAKLDPLWTRKMEQGVVRAKLALTAILDQFELSLGEVAGLRVGSTLPLSNLNDGHVRIECVERGVFLCKLGERGDRYALEIEDIIGNSPDDDDYAMG
jgi:flagellar motor switch protein FliM